MNLILEDDINAVKSEKYIMTHTTNPLLTSDTINKALKLYGNSDIDSLFTVNKVQTRFYREDGSPVNHNPDELIRTQDLEAWFEENSCLYVFTKESFSKTGARIGGKPMMFETPPLESVDIDEPEDWFMAEALLEKRTQEN
jgi:CMP-N-acetylneuraminic acid synthetase